MYKYFPQNPQERSWTSKACLSIYSLLVFLVITLGVPPATLASSQLSLHSAVQQNKLDELRTILSETGKPDTRDKAGRTALTFAAETGNLVALKILLDAGSSADVSDFLGQAPLHYAVKSPLEIASTLVYSGADIDIRNSGGITPLMIAAREGRRDMVKLLLTAGARVDFKDYQGNSAADWAQQSGDNQLVKMLTRRISALPVVNNVTHSGDNFAEDVFVDVHFPQWFQPSLLEFNEDLTDALKKGKQGILLFLSTRRCSYCKAFIDKVLSKPEIRQRVQGAFDVYGLEIFDKSEMIDPSGSKYRINEFVTANKASFTPTMIFYGAGGKKLVKIVGYYPAEKFTRVLDFLEGKHYQRESLRTYMARTNPVKEKAPKVITADPELFSRPPHMLDRRAFAAQNPLVVVFETPGCTSCELFHQRVLSDKSVRRLMGEYEAVQLDTRDTTSRIKTPDGQVMSPAKWYAKLDLSYSPSIVFFDRKGKEAMRLDSETQRFRMEGALQLVLEGAHKEDAQLQRWRWKKAIEVFKQERKKN
jgi:thioredoxin-related protein